MITRDASLLRLLNDRALCEVCRRLRLSRVAKIWTERGGVGLYFWDLALNFATAPNSNLPCTEEYGITRLTVFSKRVVILSNSNIKDLMFLISP